MNRSPAYTDSPRLARQGAFWLFLMLLVGCFAFVGFEQLTYLSSYPGAWLFSVLLLAATAIPVGLIIYRLDQFEPEPASLIAVALLWGGVVALTFAGLANTEALSFLQHIMSASKVDSWGAAIVAPLDEEFYKGTGLIMIYLLARNEINGVMDGLVYGAMIGLGFQTVENVQYFMLAVGQSHGGQVGAVVSMYFVRVILSGLYSHMLFTGLLGFGFAWFVTQRSRPFGARLGVLALCGVLAWAAHFVWDSPWLDSLMSQSTGSNIGALIIKGVPFLVLLLLMLIFARRREGRAFAGLMAAEIGGEVVTQKEFQTLQSGRRRRRELKQVRRANGPAARGLVRRLMREQMNLALIHMRSESAQHPAIEAQRDYIMTLKRRLAEVTGGPQPGARTA